MGSEMDDPTPGNSGGGEATGTPAIQMAAYHPTARRGGGRDSLSPVQPGALFDVGIGERQRRRRLDQGRQLQKRQMIVDANNLARVRLHEIIGGKLDLYAAAGAKSDRCQ